MIKVEIHNLNTAKEMFIDEQGIAKITITNYSIGERQIVASAKVETLIEKKSLNIQKEQEKVTYEQAL